MFTAENGKRALTILAVTLVALSIHQKFIAPMLVKKPTAAAGK